MCLSQVIREFEFAVNLFFRHQVEYGVEAIPERWKDALHGESPLRSGRLWFAKDFIQLADELASL